MVNVLRKFMRQLEGFQVNDIEHVFYKLKKFLYDLKQAFRQ